MRVVKLQGVRNVRDLGGTPVGADRVVRSGLLFRGGALSNITPDDRKVLFGKLGIRCVIDLRTGWERSSKPDAETPEAENLHIPFYDLEKVGIEYTEPDAGTKVVGRDIACNPLEFYRSLANPLTVRQMAQGIDAAFAHAMHGDPVLIHCNGGKDRAGILALLVLATLGANPEDILADYLYTNVSRDKRYDEMFERFLRFAEGDEKRAHELVISHRAAPENLQSFYSAVNEKYGDMNAFIRNQLGITDSRRHELQGALTEEAGEMRPLG